MKTEKLRLRPNEEIIQTNPEYRKVFEGLEHARKIINTWPEWKRNVLKLDDNIKWYKNEKFS